ncbi:MAG: HlyC/CorC family transporter [Candidatus Eisenbacteria bacterium]|uniref:HlyC/CorC family transporter n=1 Tax=Eiseniibacteriota bacterium TaxID=2212470 RepID=A0A956LX73_UNCEI|nr:HlyC/CorC family transporter [Candidatus Eisenbacteria bacterium]
MLPARVALLVLLLLFSAFFSATEAAFFSLHRVHLRRLERDGRRTSEQILKVLATPSYFLTSVLIGNTLVNVAMSVLATSLFTRWLGDRGIEVAILVTTVAVLLVGEVTPKTLAVNFPESVSRANVGILRLVQILLGPLIGAVSMMSDGILRLFGVTGHTLTPSPFLSRGELGSLLEGADREGVMTAQESRLAQNILEFASTRAEEVMTPRIDMIAAPLEMDRAELEALIIESKHSRIPIYESTIDQIIGYLPSRDFLLHPETKLAELIRPVSFFPDRAFVSVIFYETQKQRAPVTVVVNEYGETVGLLTREDLLEELVGEIYDEFEPREVPLRRIEPGLYVVSGQLNLEELNEALGLHLPEDEAVTLNGFLSGLFGGIPRKGEEIRWNGITFRVTEASRHRILHALLELGPAHRDGERPLAEGMEDEPDLDRRGDRPSKTQGRGED